MIFIMSDVLNWYIAIVFFNGTKTMIMFLFFCHRFSKGAGDSTIAGNSLGSLSADSPESGDEL